MNIKNTIHEFIELYAREFPEHKAIVCGKQSLTYRQVNQKANQLAHYLTKIGITPDAPIALCLERSVDFLITILAILKAGGAYLPLDVAQPTERLLFLLKDSQTPVLITQSVLKKQFITYEGSLICLDTDAKKIGKESIQDLQVPLNPQHLAYIIYTSGSTGAPKGVLIEHRSVINYCEWFAQYSNICAQERIDFSSSPIFDMTVSVSIVALMLGLTIVLCDDEVKKNPKRYLQHLANAHISLLKLTPSYFKLLVQETKHHFRPLPALKTMVLGGENLSATECKEWLQFYPEHILYNEYGPTEATVAVSAHEVSLKSLPQLTTNVPIGKAGTNMSAIILDGGLNPVADEESGELFIGGICLARGYLNQPELTQQKFIPDPFQASSDLRLYKTGDLCRKRADGVIEYLGRIDDQVKIRGFRIEPGEIEKHLAKHPAIESVAVVAQKDRFDEQRLVAYYILNDLNSTVTSNQIQEFLHQYLPDYMIPSVFIKVTSLPLTPNGKLDKAALPSPQFEASQHYIKPSSALEKKLVKMWAEELNIDRIGLNDNFFELGGHSLSAARIVSKISHELQKNITLYDFYKTACIKKLIPIIKRTKKATKDKNTYNLKKYNEVSSCPLSDFQFLLWMSNTFEPRAKKLNIVARKRMQGRLNIMALEFAFQAVLKKHEVLIYRILKFKPEQKARKNLCFQLIEKKILASEEHDIEKELELSMNELIDFHPWPKDEPLIIGRLFHLTNDTEELQICMPHLISDHASIEILFSDLSKFYLLYHSQPIEEIKTDSHYKKYIFTERNTIETALDKDILFWEDYLKDTSLFAFPEEYIVKDMKAAQLPYSTYAEIPKSALNNLKSFCELNHISINNGLCAILALALRECCDTNQNETPYTLMNIIKSTRENPIYDHSIGCFLRVEPVKINLNEQLSLPELAQQIHQSTIETSNYQQCSNLIKFSSASTFNQKRKIHQHLLDLLTPLYTKFLQIPPVYRKILKRCGGRLISFKRTNHFLINLNVRNNFIFEGNREEPSFGLKLEPIQNYQEELLAIDSVFEACFFCDDNKRTHYLVISANLKPEFRMLITQQVIQIMSKQVFETNLSLFEKTMESGSESLEL